MTTVVGIQSKDFCILAADSQITEDNLRTISLKTPKIIEKGQYLLAITGDTRPGDILTYNWNPPTYKISYDPVQFMGKRIIPSIIKTFNEGGIVRYGEKYGNDGLWEGSLYTFDARMSIDFAPNAALIGRCDICGAQTKDFHNCIDPSCHEQLLLCTDCAKDPMKRRCPTLHRANYDRELIG